MLILRALSSCDFFLRRRLSGQWERCSAAPPPVLILALPLDKEGGGNRLASLPDVIVGGCGDQSEAVGGRRPTAMQQQSFSLTTSVTPIAGVFSCHDTHLTSGPLAIPQVLDVDRDKQHGIQELCVIEKKNKVLWDKVYTRVSDSH